jgi:hypothetical protein
MSAEVKSTNKKIARVNAAINNLPPNNVKITISNSSEINTQTTISIKLLLINLKPEMVFVKVATSRILLTTDAVNTKNAKTLSKKTI